MHVGPRIGNYTSKGGRHGTRGGGLNPLCDFPSTSTRLYCDEVYDVHNSPHSVYVCMNVFRRRGSAVNTRSINAVPSSSGCLQSSSVQATPSLSVTSQSFVQPIRHRLRSRLAGLLRQWQLGAWQRLPWQPEPTGYHGNGKQQRLGCSAASSNDSG